MYLLRLVEGDLQCVISSRDVGDDKMFDIRLSDEDIFDLNVYNPKDRSRSIFLTLSKNDSTEQDILCTVQINSQFLDCDVQDVICMSEQVCKLIKQ